MNREIYINEVEKRLNQLFSASKDGYKASPVERHRLEGFMRAGVFMCVVSSDDMAQLMHSCHFSVFGKTIEQRKSELSTKWQDEAIDYSHYEQPAYERKC